MIVKPQCMYDISSGVCVGVCVISDLWCVCVISDLQCVGVCDIRSAGCVCGILGRGAGGVDIR